MPGDRRYSDEEVRRIFALATSGDAPGAAPGATAEGLTLAELQDVGRQVGVEPALVARAAHMLDAGGEVLPRGRTLGMPTSVGRVVDLPRAPTDHEWELLVTELRTTFGAAGYVESRGGVREWWNGNLHAFIEPTVSGQRLRLTTTKGDATSLNLAGGFLVAFGAMLTAILLAKGKPEALVLPGFFSVGGLGILATNLFGLPRWARLREQQMEHIAAHAKALLSAPDEEEGS